MIKLHFEKLSRYNRISEPCSVAVPFKEGLLQSTEGIAITDGLNLYKAQCVVTARWKDNSIKWLLVNFLADLPGNNSKDYFLVLDNEKKIQLNEKVDIIKTENIIQINTGTLKLELSNKENDTLFNKIQFENNVYIKDEIVGPTIKNEQRQIFNVLVGCSGWHVIEQGPIRAIVSTCGKHYDENKNAFIDYIFKITTYAGKPWVECDYTIINKEDSDKVINSVEINLLNKGTKEQIKTALATSNYLSKIVENNGEEKLSKLIDAEYLKYDANEHFSEVFYGTFWADYKTKEKGGVCATIHQAYQNFPKALEVDKDGISIKIVPDGDFILPQGVAKTHKLFLHFHSYEEDIKDINVRTLQFQMPDRAILDESVYKESNIYEDIFVENKVAEAERLLIHKADSRARAYGMLHFGDAPDLGYTSQGRGNGEPVWTNNEYDFPHAAMLCYARTGVRRMLDYMLVSAKHWMDVDICHYSTDPLRQDGQVEHSARHNSGPIEISHEWVEGLFDYYHMTGDKRAYEIAIKTGDNILRHLALPRYHKKGEINARETGWALRSLVALYKETYDEKWLKPADMIVGHFESWKEEYGEWLAPYTDHTAIRVPFMIGIAVGSLIRYYKINPLEKIKKLIIDAVDDMVENCLLDTGLFYYKELPSLSRLGNNTILLEALTEAYDLTGNIKYLEAGLPTFLKEVKGSIGPMGGGKQIVKDAVILGGPGPKNFAQSFYPLTCYYRAVAKENLYK